MTIINIILFFLALLFFIMFFYYLLNKSQHLIGYRVIKDPIIDISSESDELNNKYKFTKCNQMCSQDFCDEYHTQVIKYDLCKECNKENKCYDPEQGICVSCKNNYSCEQLFGCSNKPPRDPLNNFCTKCWQ